MPFACRVRLCRRRIRASRQVCCSPVSYTHLDVYKRQALALLAGRSFRLSWPELRTVFFLSLFRAATSLSLVIAYQHIASGVASTIHFMYPLAVALAMMCFFREKGSVWVFAAIGMSIVGAVLLSLGNVDFTRGNTTLGMVSACLLYTSSVKSSNGTFPWH